MPTVMDAINETKDHLYGPYRMLLDELAVTVAPTDTLLTLTFTETMRRNTVLSIEGEDVLVRGWDGGSKVATVRRGWRGTVATAHTATSEVEVNPRFTSGSIMRALRQEIDGWPTSLFRGAAISQTLTGPYNTFASLDLAYDDVLRLIDVGWKQDARDLAWHWMAYPRLRLDANLRTMVEFGDALSPGDIIILLGRKFVMTTWTATTDLVTDCGLQREMCDIPAMGAAIRLLSFNEIPRSDRQVQGEPRIAAESPAGAAIQTAAQLEKMRLRRIGEEANRLVARFRQRSW